MKDALPTELQRRGQQIIQNTYQGAFFHSEDGVHVEEFVELAHLEEEDGVEVGRLDLPPLALGRLELENKGSNKTKGLVGSTA